MVQVFAGRDLDGQLLGLAELAPGLEAAGMIGQFAQRRGIGGKPGEAVGGMLFLVQKARIDLAARHHPGRQTCLGLGEKGLDNGRRLVEVAHQVGHANR